MDEKYIYGLAGVVLGGFLAFLRELYAEHRSKRRDAEYLAIRMICELESFMEGCALVVGDNGLYHGQPDADGHSRIQVPSPQISMQLEDVNWKSLPPDLMYELLYFPNIVKDAESYVSSTFEHVATPPDYGEGFEERQYQYSELGVTAAELAAKLRKKYQIPKRHITSWDVVEYMNSERSKIKALRKQREIDHESR